jgi:hypothetical protein
MTGSRYRGYVSIDSYFSIYEKKKLSWTCIWYSAFNPMRESRTKPEINEHTETLTDVDYVGENLLSNKLLLVSGEKNIITCQLFLFLSNNILNLTACK